VYLIVGFFLSSTSSDNLSKPARVTSKYQENKRPMKIMRAVMLMVLSISLAGCASIGAHKIEPDRAAFTNAIGDSWKSQMLLNIVKIRYGDAPIFLDVSSVISSYAMEEQLNFGFSWSSAVLATSQNLGGYGRYTDRPTITYNPLMGEKFARALMTPIPPPALLSMIQAGYRADMVMRIAFNSINGVRNRYGGGGRLRKADPEFYHLTEEMREIQSSGAMGMRVNRGGDRTSNSGTVMILRGKGTQDVEQGRGVIRQILGLNPTADEFAVAYGSVAKDDHEIAILSRSVLEILVDLASYIDVPAVHVEEKRVIASFVDENGAGQQIPPLIRIRSSVSKPDDALVAVPYRGYWFWIDDRDMPSKAIFAFLMFIFTLTETGGKDSTPIVTIPAG
jgi:hypothetical protein